MKRMLKKGLLLCLVFLVTTGCSEGKAKMVSEQAADREVTSEQHLSVQEPNEDEQIFLEPQEKESESITGKEIVEVKENKEGERDVVSGKTAYLTFDDGPSPITNQVLDILKEKNIKATFFVVGKSIEKNREILERIVEEGHAVGNHTYSHNYSYIYKSVDNFFEDFQKNEDLIQEVTGLTTKLVRLPGGSNNVSSIPHGGKFLMYDIIKKLEEQEYVYFDWNMSSKDASNWTPTVQQMVYSTLNQTQEREQVIILFHDTINKNTTVEALPGIIQGLEDMGYGFESLSEESYRVWFPLRKPPTTP
ncbi:MAG: polysaccharide deacetylase family protein [Bacillota bacterium]